MEGFQPSLAAPCGLAVCHALGEIIVSDDEVLKMIQGGSVGVGQLFRHLGVLPTFTLQRAGKISLNDHLSSLLSSADGLPRVGHTICDMTESTRESSRCNPLQHTGGYVLWREYELRSPQLSCSFLETFLPDFLELHSTARS